jgi:hypothetical protein
MTSSIEPVGWIEPGYGWFGEQYVPVWRIYVDGRQQGVWTNPRAARRALRYQMRQARRMNRRS